MPGLFHLPTQEAGNRASPKNHVSTFGFHSLLPLPILSFLFLHSSHSPPSSTPASCLPYVPEQGTVGASGDLAPLSHLALGMMGEGQMWSPETGWDNAKQVCLNRKVYSLHEGTIVNETHQFKKNLFCAAQVTLAESILVLHC